MTWTLMFKTPSILSGARSYHNGGGRVTPQEILECALMHERFEPPLPSFLQAALRHRLAEDPAGFRFRWGTRRGWIEYWFEAH